MASALFVASGCEEGEPGGLSARGEPAYEMPAADTPDMPDPTGDTEESACSSEQAGLVFLNRFPPAYTSGADDAAANRSRLADPGNTANTLSDDEWSRFVACFRRAVAPFNVGVLETEPNGPEYVELAVLGAWGRWADAPAMTGSVCGQTPRPVAMVFADAPSPDFDDVSDKLCRYAVGIWAVSATQLDYVNERDDFVADQPEGPGEWRDEEIRCRSGRCSCTGLETQNSYRTVLDRFGAACTTPADPPDDSETGPGDETSTEPVQQHESCLGEALCMPGLECIEYYGFGGETGEAFASCEIRCESDLDCPGEQTCVEISDGPGLVCL